MANTLAASLSSRGITLDVPEDKPDRPLAQTTQTLTFGIKTPGVIILQTTTAWVPSRSTSANCAAFASNQLKAQLERFAISVEKLVWQSGKKMSLAFHSCSLGNEIKEIKTKASVAASLGLCSLHQRRKGNNGVK